MRKLSFLEIQNRGNSILAHMKDVCDANNISFFLAYGTVLGAVRHKGFIPWDDDIDVYFTRDEYSKFAEVVRSEDSQFRLMSVTTDKDYCHPLAKYVDTSTHQNWHIVKVKPNYGVWVDIYVLDNVPDNNLTLRLFQSRLNFLQSCYEYALYRTNKKRLKGIIKTMLLWWTDLLGPRFFALKMVRLSQRFNRYNTRRFAPNSFTAASRAEAVLDKDILGHGIEMSFEGKLYLVPKNTDAYLRHFYGDYMSLPPEEKRKPNHSADFYLSDNE